MSVTLSREGEEEASWALGQVGEDGVWAGSFHTGNRTGAGYSLLVRDDRGQEAGLGDVALGEVREGLGVTGLRVWWCRCGSAPASPTWSGPSTLCGTASRR